MKIVKLCSFLLGISIVLSGCGSTGNNSDEPELGFGMKTALCTLGGVAGAYFGEDLANKFLEKSEIKYTNKERELLVKGFQVGLFLTFCAITNYAGDTIYKKLSKQGLENRKKQVREAAIRTESTSYSDPQNPNAIGRTEPIETYTQDDGTKQCIVIKDTLTIDQSSEVAMTTLCKEIPNGEYEETV